MLYVCILYVCVCERELTRLCKHCAQAGKTYRWVMIQAATMKWMHLSFDKPGCVMGLYSRDANMLNQIPRLTDNIVFAAANRSGLLVFCFCSISGMFA
jgi:hypothetical protein